MSDGLTDVAWGRMLERLDSIKTELRELKERLVWRIDNLEGRVEELEKADAGLKPYAKIIERAVWALLVIGVAAGPQLL